MSNFVPVLRVKTIALFLICGLLLGLAVPVMAQDGLAPLSDGDILFQSSQIVGLLIVGLLGGGVGYILRAVKEGRDERFMTLLENQYNQSHAALKQTVSTLESVTRYLAVSVPMSANFRESFLAVADFVDEVTDGVPIVNKNPLADSPSDPALLPDDAT